MDSEIKPVKAEQAPAAPARRADVKTVTDWATAKGMLPEFHERPRRNAPPKAAPALVHNKDFAPYSAACASLHWRVNTELTEAEFDKAIADTKAHVYR